MEQEVTKAEIEEKIAKAGLHVGHAMDNLIKFYQEIARKINSFITMMKMTDKEVLALRNVLDRVIEQGTRLVGVFRTKSGHLVISVNTRKVRKNDS